MGKHRREDSQESQNQKDSKTENDDRPVGWPIGNLDDSRRGRGNKKGQGSDRSQRD